MKIQPSPLNVIFNVIFAEPAPTKVVGVIILTAKRDGSDSERHLHYISWYRPLNAFFLLKVQRRFWNACRTRQLCEKLRAVNPPLARDISREWTLTDEIGRDLASDSTVRNESGVFLSLRAIFTLVLKATRTPSSDATIDADDVATGSPWASRRPCRSRTSCTPSRS